MDFSDPNDVGAFAFAMLVTLSSVAYCLYVVLKDPGPM